MELGSFFGGAHKMSQKVSADQVMEMFVVGRELHITNATWETRGPISVITVKDGNLLVRNRWLVRRPRDWKKDDEWRPVRHSRGFTEISGPFLFDECFGVSGVIGDSFATIRPRGLVADMEYPIKAI